MARLATVNVNSNDSIAEWTREETDDAGVSTGVHWKIRDQSALIRSGLEGYLGYLLPQASMTKRDGSLGRYSSGTSVSERQGWTTG
jgi:hypothetical protein